MKTAMFTIIISLALAAPGCAGTPKPQVVAAADYGVYPSNYDAIIHAWIKRSFFDPYSIRDLKIGVPEKFWVQDAPIEGSKTHFGYMVAVALNGKNRFGAYTGIQGYRILIRDGRVVAQQNMSEGGALGPQWLYFEKGF
jgi:hypothetical protein